MDVLRPRRVALAREFRGATAVVTESKTIPAPSPAGITARPTPVRLVSLDAFRGLTILGMLLVNNVALGGKTPPPLVHADWSGAVHFADLVFPWFLFIAGVAVPYSAASARRKHLPTWQFDVKAASRGAILVLLGCLIDSALARRPVFDLGVLQLIGLAYTVTVLVGGLLPLRGRLLLSALLLVAHSAFLRLGSISGLPPGRFGPNDNVIDAINNTYLAPYNLKGLLSVIPATALMLIGTAAGDLIRRKKITPMAKVGVLTICGAGLIAAGWLWSHDLPMNKPLWTAPYILYTAGWGCIVLGAMYLLIDVLPGRWAAVAAFPLVVAGTNAIAAYVAPILTKALVLRNVHVASAGGRALDGEQALIRWFHDHAGPVNGGWLYTFAYITGWWLVLLFLYRKQWFLKV
jgi:predicted acyltransferase